MSFFDDILAADAALYTDPEGMPGAEAVTYISGTVRRSIFAQVYRGGVTPMPNSAGGVSPVATIYVANNATTGIAGSELKATDQASLDLLLNGTTKTLSLQRGAGSDGRWDIDAGMLRLELR